MFLQYLRYRASAKHEGPYNKNAKKQIIVTSSLAENSKTVKHLDIKTVIVYSSIIRRCVAYRIESPDRLLLRLQVVAERIAWTLRLRILVIFNGPTALR